MRLGCSPKFSVKTFFSTFNLCQDKFSCLPVPLGRFFSTELFLWWFIPFKVPHLFGDVSSISPLSWTQTTVFFPFWCSNFSLSRPTNLPETSSASSSLLTMLTVIFLLLLALEAFPCCPMSSFQWVFIASWPIFITSIYGGRIFKLFSLPYWQKWKLTSV